MVAGGLLLPLLLALYQLFSLSLDPLSGAWYLLLLVTGGHIGMPTTLLWAALAGVLGSRARDRARRARPRPARPGGDVHRCAAPLPTRARLAGRHGVCPMSGDIRPMGWPTHWATRAVSGR